MKRMPKTNPKRVSDSQLRRLERWVREWEIHRHISDDPDVPEETLETTPWRESAPDVAPSAAAGQIRLVHPRFLAPHAPPLYVAVLRPERTGAWLAAPYGPFSEPALPGELLTGRTQPCLRVLCLWNARLLPGRLAGQTWIADSMSDAEVEDALRVAAAALSGEKLPGELSDRVGPMLWHPDDPRQAYCDQQAALLDALVAAAGAPAECGLYFPKPGNEGKRVLPLAAEERGEYKPRTDSSSPESEQPGTSPRSPAEDS